jgi:hypothetical protein
MRSRTKKSGPLSGVVSRRDDGKHILATPGNNPDQTRPDQTFQQHREETCSLGHRAIKMVKSLSRRPTWSYNKNFLICGNMRYKISRVTSQGSWTWIKVPKVVVWCRHQLMRHCICGIYFWASAVKETDLLGMNRFMMGMPGMRWFILFGKEKRIISSFWVGGIGFGLVWLEYCCFPFESVPFVLVCCRIFH